MLLLALSLFGTARAEEARLAVLHTTDLHGALTPFDYLADRPAPRGLVRLASMVEAVRRESLATLLLDAGDCIQGGPIETVYRSGSQTLPEPMITAMGRMRYDAMAVGNHEFSFGTAALEKTRTAASFPWLAANVVHTTDGTPAFPGSLVKTLGPLRVGVVGVCTPAVPALEDSANLAGLRFLPPVEAARREVERLRGAERCDVVVLLAHTGLERDPATGAGRQGDTPGENWGYRLAAEVKGVDLVILGHTHAVVAAAEIGGTLVTQAGRWGENLGRVDLSLSRASAGEPWKLTSRRAQVLAVTDSTPSDAALAAFAEPYDRDTRAELARVIGEATREIASPRGRFDNGPVWGLIHRVQLEVSGADVSLAALPDPSARIARGPVTLRDLMRLYPYDNALGAVELTGAELKETLEQSARFLAEYAFESGRPLAVPGMPGYNFDSAEGVGYEIDLTRPAGERIQHLSFRGEPLAPERRLKVVANSYRLNGGGGFEAVRRAPRVWRTTREVRELLVEYCRRERTLDGSFTRDWVLLPDYSSLPERPLIDLLVRQGVLQRNEVLRIGADSPARRGDMAYWLSRAFGWREKKLSGAFADVSDSLAPWLDGLLKRRVLGARAALDRFDEAGVALRPVALDWCERAARAARYAVSPTYDRAFREGLMTGLGPGVHGDTLTHAEALGLVANLRFPTLRILETTDFHGAILPTSRARETRRPVGGSAVLAAHLERLRAQNPAGTLLLDGGDSFQGTMISNLQFGRLVVEQMNALRYAAMVIGNHDFDWSADTLERRVREMHFAALGANMRERKSGRLPRWVRADTVISRRGVRAGVLGLCYTRTPSVTLARNVRHLEFGDDSVTAARLVPRLRARSDVVIVLGHTPAESDTGTHATGGDLPRLARGVRGVDAWFGGHSHNQVLDRIQGAPVMLPGSNGQMIAVCDLIVDPVGRRVVESHMELVTTYADEVRPDSAMQARVERWNSAVAPIASAPLGRSAQALRRNRSGESGVGDLVTDAMRAAAQADIALQNAGGLRADLPEGVITRGTVYEVMPFDNLIVTLDLTGAELLRALEQGLRGGRVTQVSGIRYSFDLSRPEMQRLVSVTDASGAALDSAKTYRVACPDFMATGGDDYNVLSGGRNRTDTGLLVRDALEAYIAERCKDGRVLEFRPDGRIQRMDKRGDRD
jgi:2',3'-cyclic-nucleotide 2'-phosphodiesterase/3'-nucleotidase